MTMLKEDEEQAFDEQEAYISCVTKLDKKRTTYMRPTHQSAQVTVQATMLIPCQVVNQ